VTDKICKYSTKGLNEQNREVKMARFVFLFLLVAFVFFGSFTYGAEPSQDLEIILDASGSMWAKIGTEPKIAIAKKVLTELVDGLKTRDDLALAVRVYGHQSPQQQKNCRDTKLEIPFGPPDAAKVSGLIKRINAQGQTPIAYSLLQSKNDFDLKAKRKRTIVLITDGIESCNGDPCVAAKELAAAGIDVTLHVVGFDLKKEEMEKLKCLTEPSKGLLLPAQDANQLKDALGQVMKKALAQNLVLNIFGPSKTPIDAYAEVVKPGTTEIAGSGHGKRIALGLPAGTYDINVRSDVTNERRTISGIAVREDEKTERDVIFANGKLIGVVKDTAGNPVPARIEVLEIKGMEEKFVSARDNSAEKLIFELPPGTYKMVFQNTKTHEKKATENIVLEDGKEITKEFSFAQGRIKGIAKDASGKAVKTHVEIVRIDGMQEKFWDAGYTSDEAKTFDVPPGIYKMTFVNEANGERKVTDQMTVGEGQEISKEMRF